MKKRDIALGRRRLGYRIKDELEFEISGGFIRHQESKKKKEKEICVKKLKIIKKKKKSCCFTFHFEKTKGRESRERARGWGVTILVKRGAHGKTTSMYPSFPSIKKKYKKLFLASVNA